MMTARSRGYNQDWDPMREDFDNSSYDPQNADDNSSGYVNLDHCRLYVTNIPNGLSDDGLSTAFSKYGRLTEVYVSKNPDKRYGLVAFETSGEAKLAMMKLNRTEPLNLKINIAHKSNAKSKKSNEKRDNRSTNSNGRSRDDRSIRDKTGSSGSRSNLRRQDSMANGDNMEDLIDDDAGLSGTLEPDVNLELEKLKLEHLKLQEAQVLCKHRMLLLKQAERKSSAGSRCILPDGRIVVRNADKGESHDADGSFGAGAGDAPKIPGLQSFGACVACGQRAEAFCSGCRVTPYCSPACQRRDWLERHRNTCHNLKRQSVGVASRLEIEPETQAAAPLRRPRSPDASPRDAGPRESRARDSGPRDAGPRDAGPRNAGPRDAGPRDAGPRDAGPRDAGPRDAGPRESRPRDSGPRDAGPRDSSNDRFPPRKFGPPGIAATPTPAAKSYNNSRNAGGNNRTSQDSDKGPSDRGRFNRSNDAKPSEKPAEAKPAPKPSPVAKEQPFSPKATPTADAASAARPMASVADVAPVSARKPSAPVQTKPASAQAKPALVPKNCVIDTLALKDTFMLTAETEAEGGSGFICVTLHVDHSDNYERLLDPLSQACEASEACEPHPGDTFAYLDPTDGGWYRARCLLPTRAALLDAARVATLTATDQCRRLHADYAVIPEFCCQLESDRVQLKDQVQCTLVSKSGSDLTVSIINLETGAALGFGTVRRWLPAVERPQEPRPEPEPASCTAPAVTATAPWELPQVPRPAVTAGAAYLLVDCAEPCRLFVRPADLALQAEFNDVLCEVALYGADDATPRLTELPRAGQTVVARYSDGNHYRALVQRVSSKHRRCLLEYIEYGNAAVVEDLQSLSACPPQFSPSARPTLTSAAALLVNQNTFSAAATAYLDKLKDDEEPLTLTIPSGEQSGPSKTAVRLTVVKSGEEVNRTVDTLSTPEWQKLLERGGDVLETESLSFQQITYEELPGAVSELDIFDCSLLEHGLLSGHARAADHAKRAHALSAQLNEYCSSALAKDPYTPKLEELCIAMCPNRKQWARAVLMEQIGGAGGAVAHVLFYDYGHLAHVPVAALRKMMPEFARHVPAAAVTLQVKDFPPEPTEAQLERARRHLQLDARGFGTLQVTRVTKQDVAEYRVHAPGLIHALHTA